MLTILGKNSEKFCDGHSRRSFLKIGGMAMGGASLPEILRAEADAGQPPQKLKHKAVIMVFLAGGPPHQDMWDIKTDAPSEIRGEFSEIPTNVPGIRIGEEFPKIAKMADKFAFIRSMVGAEGPHDAMMCLTGRKGNSNVPPGGWPSIGAAVSSLQGKVNDACPPFIGLSPKCGHDEWGDPGKSGFLGPSNGAFTPFRGGGKEDIVLKGIDLERLDDRRGLLTSFDNFRRDADSSGMIEGLDTFNKQAFGVLTSSKLATALDISKEDPRLIEKYGKGTEKLTADGPWKRLDQFLMARRLVEAGARCVTLGFSRWDWHGANFKRGREDFPLLDQGLSTLVQDLHDRGLDKDVSVVVWGEFGRTPKINANAGRDHWPRVSCALMAGGGMNTGQVIGSTDRLGGEAVDRPVEFPEVFSTLYHNMGIDARATTVKDLGGRPHYLVDSQHAPMRELVG
ncbi:DUF1501 domain-containing protein [Verrucomicrobiales bacterium]|nr:DUF1501 domain-containing protein [Verrucomicrobiales bacterium]MDB4662563.1 DUF1501 domain-containing protein [Verrucomicrobiales bacterium]MDC0322419.1 DUF1501 domain-containing protein [Verrucomicrobiales bacterium]